MKNINAIFDGGRDHPLKLRAQSADDIMIIAALIQDAVLPSTEISLCRSTGRFAMLLNRVRWERFDTPAQRVCSVLVIDWVRKMWVNGMEPIDKKQALSLLTINFKNYEDGQGIFSLIFAGDGNIELDVECVDIILQDTTRPYNALSGYLPDHQLDLS